MRTLRLIYILIYNHVQRARAISGVLKGKAAVMHFDGPEGAKQQYFRFNQIINQEKLQDKIAVDVIGEKKDKLLIYPVDSELFKKVL